MKSTFVKTSIAAIALAALAACSSVGAPVPMSGALSLSGSQEVPPVSTAAAGSGSIKVEPDGSVSGSITTTGLMGTMAHIHSGAMGANGPVIVPLVKAGDGVWSVPPGAKLTTEQRKAYMDGMLYVNVHSDANKGGEIRAQIKP